MTPEAPLAGLRVLDLTRLLPGPLATRRLAEWGAEVVKIEGPEHDGQDDGARLLFDVYRYLDARLGGVHAALDADDLLVVMSDHGIRTAMEHDKPALFILTGPGVPVARLKGSPPLRGVPRALAQLLGVETPWPDAGLVPRSAFAKAVR